MCGPVPHPGESYDLTIMADERERYIRALESLLLEGEVSDLRSIREMRARLSRAHKRPKEPS